VILREATAEDVAFVMATERLPDYENTVGRWEREQHEAEMAKPGSTYLIAEEGGQHVAFAILQTLDDVNGNIYLKRLAVTRRGEGIGVRAMACIQDWVFARPGTHRFYLHYAVTNERGQRMYARAGFIEEGREREVYKLLDGTRIDSVQVSMLRQEWQKRR
jgi:diamine N-acetyltransferase